MPGRVGMRMLHYGQAVAKIKNSRTFLNIHFFVLFFDLMIDMNALSALSNVGAAYLHESAVQQAARAGRAPGGSALGGLESRQFSHCGPGGDGGWAAQPL